MRRVFQSGPGSGDRDRASVVAEQSVMSDLDQAVGKNMEEKTPDELDPTEGHRLDAVLVGVVLISEVNGPSVRVDGAEPTGMAVATR